MMNLWMPTSSDVVFLILEIGWHSAMSGGCFVRRGSRGIFLADGLLVFIKFDASSVFNGVERSIATFSNLSAIKMAISQVGYIYKAWS
jgi:hypothetical protein